MTKEYLTKHLQIVITEEENKFFEELRTKAQNKSRSDFARKIIILFVINAGL